MNAPQTPKPCPFCGAEMVEAGAFRTRTTHTFIHDAEGMATLQCPASNIRIIIGGDTDAERLRMWNAAPRAGVEKSPPPMEGTLAELRLQPGEEVERLTGHDKWSEPFVGERYRFENGNLKGLSEGWTTLEDRGRFKRVAPPPPGPQPACWIDQQALLDLQATSKHSYATVYRSDEAAGLHGLDSGPAVPLYTRGDTK